MCVKGPVHLDNPPATPSRFKLRQRRWGARWGRGLQLFAGCLSLDTMPTTQPLTEAALQEARRQNALAQLRRRYDELDQLTGQNAAERVEAMRQRRRKR